LNSEEEGDKNEKSKLSGYPDIPQGGIVGMKKEKRKI
jgi:hypothetical protein